MQYKANDECGDVDFREVTVSLCKKSDGGGNFIRSTRINNSCTYFILRSIKIEKEVGD
jgi:hypothetical protein